MKDVDERLQMKQDELQVLLSYKVSSTMLLSVGVDHHEIL